MRSFINLLFAKRGRRGDSEIISGVILFVIILSVLVTYFYVIQQDTSQYQSYVNLQNSQNIATNQEVFSVAGWTKTVGSCSQCIFANVTNRAQSSLLVTQIFIANNSNGAILKAYSVPSASQGINPLSTSSISSTVPYTFGWSYIIKVVSSNGNTAQTLFPNNFLTTQAIAQALVANGLGSLTMVFRSFYSYAVKTNPCCSVDFSNKYNGSLAPCCTSTPVAFSVQVTDVDPNQAIIALDSRSLLWGSISCTQGCGTQSSPVWYIGNVDPTKGTISPTFSTVYLRYNVTNTLWFVSNCPLSSCTYSSTTTVIVSSSFTYANFVLLSGDYSVNGISSPYGQNLPFESVFFADNIGVVSNSPGSVTSGMSAQTFTLTITNAPITPIADPITRVVMTVDNGFTNVNATAPNGWTVSIAGNVITWISTGSSGNINSGKSQQFSWSANVPTVSTPTNYIHVVTLTFSGGTVRSELLAAGTYVH
jgi:hypothetical protein